MSPLSQDEDHAEDEDHGKDDSQDDKKDDNKGGDKKRGKQDSDAGEDDNGKKAGDDKKAGGDKEDGDGKDGKDKDGEKGGKKKSRLPIIIAVIVVVIVIIAAAIFWFLNRNLESTDDAYTEGNAVAIAPKVAGYVVERWVDDNYFVHAGDLMMRIDPRDYLTARGQAKANLALARAQLAAAEVDLQVTHTRAPANLEQAKAQLVQSRASQANAAREFHRQSHVDQRATTQTNVDQARTQLESNDAAVASAQAQVAVAALIPQTIETSADTVRQRQAQVEQAAANLAQAELNLSYTMVRAPQDGRVTRRNVDVGTYAQAGQQVFYLVAPFVWVVANFKETQLARMHLGQHVDIDVDAYPKLKLHGHIDSIQEGSGARFTTFPSENATGNYVKIVRRVPVKIVIDGGLDPQASLPLGLSVEPTVTLDDH